MGKDPEEKEDEKLTEELMKKLDEQPFYENKLEWADDPETETVFVTALENFELPSGREIEEGKAYEVTAELAEKLIGIGEREEGFVRHGFKCPKCKEIMREEKEPYECLNPNCNRKKLNPIHPHSAPEVEEALRNNYRFMSVRESIQKNKTPIVYMYVGDQWIKEGVEGFVKEKAAQLRPHSRSRLRSEVFKNIVEKSQVPQKRLGAPKEKVVVENGVLDLSHNPLELGDHDPDLKATSKVNARWNPDAEAPKFEKLVSNLFPREKDRERIQKLLGTALVTEKLHKKGAVIVGPTDSGKSTFAKIIRGVLGDDSVESESLSDLATTRWAGIALLDSKLNIAYEMTSGRIGNGLNELKKILAGEETKVEDKGTPKIEIKPYTEHLYCANQTPQVERQAQAFWRRWFVIETRDSIPKEEQDPDIVDKILENEREGVLNWMVEGYLKFKENGNKFTHPQNWTDSRSLWLGWGDSIQRFIEDCIEEGPREKYTPSLVYDLYLEYCHARPRLEPGSQRNLTSRIKRMVPFASYSNKYRFEGDSKDRVQKRGFKGIHINVGKLGTPLSDRLSSDLGKKEGERRVKSGKVMTKRYEGPVPNLPSDTYVVTEKFKHGDKIFEEGEKITDDGDLSESMEGAIEKAVERGYAEKLESSGGGGGGEDDRSLAQKDKVRRLYEIVRELQDEHELGALLSAVKSEAEAEAISPGFVDEFVEMEKEKGRILTHEDGEYVEVVDH
ncbi:hypothetical protein AKJ37_02425 [candidate division MSBL1 archaeon SCGC-AAA259I09]|uniref:SF3 helicase domain-containing protein n=1 Tax=candidate division MSBL1 archaeon SCGC-AAA259I09 TaxID=1698267 RepID=A0A133UU44_9EURY|nr:hypothetical protein AKJ37_02425 [candidate division MSBL1 archaeon SCGC-AAA259I09]